MKEKLDFIRLPLLLVFIFFVGKLALGAAGVSYETSNQFFSMVILQVHLAILWGGVGRRYGGYSIGGAVTAVVMIVLFSQILIWGATLVSYAAGLNTYFNDPMAVMRTTEPVSFGIAMGSRAFGLVVNCVIGAILGTIGYALGGLIPAGKAA